MVKNMYRKCFFIIMILNNVAKMKAMESKQEKNYTITSLSMKQKNKIDKIIQNQLQLLILMGKESEFLEKYAKDEFNLIILKNICGSILADIGIKYFINQALTFIRFRISNQIFNNELSNMNNMFNINNNNNNNNNILNDRNAEDINTMLNLGHNSINILLYCFFMYKDGIDIALALTSQDLYIKSLINYVNNDADEISPYDDVDCLIRKSRSEKSRRKVLQQIQTLESQKLYLMHNFLGFNLGEKWKHLSVNQELKGIKKVLFELFV